MGISRRGFLKAMLAAAAAPAICKAENLMKIYVPPQEIILLPEPEILSADDFTFGTQDFTVECFIHPTKQQLDALGPQRWYQFARVYNGGKVQEFVDGKLVPIGTQEKLVPGVKLVGSEKDRERNFVIVTPSVKAADLRLSHAAEGCDLDGYIDDIRTTKAIRNPAQEFERFRGDYESQHGKFPKRGMFVSKQEPQRNKLLDWMMDKTAPILTINGQALT